MNEKEKKHYSLLTRMVIEQSEKMKDLERRLEKMQFEVDCLKQIFPPAYELEEAVHEGLQKKLDTMLGKDSDQKVD